MKLGLSTATYISTHLFAIYEDLSQDIFFNLIHSKKTVLFITVSNHGDTQRIFTGQKNESALTERNEQGLNELHS